jgi:hypothetical protein
LCQKRQRIRVAGGLPHYALFVCVHGEGSIREQPFKKGQVWLLPAGAEAFAIESGDAEWLLAYPGSESLPDISVG